MSKVLTPEEIKRIMTPSEDKTDIQLQNEALQRDKASDAALEKKLLSNEETRQSELTQALAKPQPEPELTAKDLKKSLIGTVEDRMKEEKTIYLTLSYGSRPDVVFSGFWNGKLVNNAMNAISRAYRVQKHKNIRANATQPN